MSDKKCPNCGACKECGAAPQRFYPAIPYVPYAPGGYIPWRVPYTTNPQWQYQGGTLGGAVSGASTAIIQTFC